jgi:hypothetical protein
VIGRLEPSGGPTDTGGSRGPTAAGKWPTASVVDDIATVVAAGFDEPRLASTDPRARQRGSPGLSWVTGMMVADREEDRGRRCGGRHVERGGKGHASPYATGGGTVLEHTYGAALLAALLREWPVRGLGEDVTPVEVRFQQGASYPVDDLVVVGLSPTGPRTMFVAVRRDPTIGASSAAFVTLTVDFLRMVVSDGATWPPIRGGRVWRWLVRTPQLGRSPTWPGSRASSVTMTPSALP